MARKHFHRQKTYWQYLRELRRNPFAFAVALVTASVLLSVLLAASAATASDAPMPAGIVIDRDRDVALIYAVRAADPQIQVSAIQELTGRRATDATDALLAATFDTNARVREEATVALGKLGAWRALPRLQELQITQGNEYIQFAAYEAERQIFAQVAEALHIPRAALAMLTVVAKDEGYAAANETVYALREEMWKPVGRLPDTPHALVLADTGLYAATFEQGLWRSVDGGKTWEHVQFGRDTPTRTIITALTLDPQNGRYMYGALAQIGLDGFTRTPLGIAASADGGATWSLLPDSPAWALTTRLVCDPQTPGYLFGKANGEPWRFTLGDLPTFPLHVH